MDPSSDPRIDAGIAVFNQGRHWHAHEEWEGVWLESTGDDRTFVQGLIMVAAMLVHYGRPNPAGVIKHWANVQQRLPRFAPSTWGVDVAGLLSQLEAYVEDARGSGPPSLDPGAVQIARSRE